MLNRKQVRNFSLIFNVILLLCPCRSPLFAQQNSENATALNNSIQILNITNSEVTVQWNSIEPSTGQAFAVDPGVGSIIERSVLDNALKTAHQHIIRNLKPNKNYKIYVAVRNSAGKLTFSDYSPAQSPDLFKFTTLPFNESASLDYVLRVFGPTNVVRGNKSYWEVEAINLAGTPQHLYLNGISGLPQATNYRFFCAIASNSTGDCYDEAATGRQYQWKGSDGRFWIEIDTPTNAPLGTFNVQVSTSAGAISRSINKTLIINSNPAPPSSSAVTSIPSIPSLEEWEHQIYKYGHKFCDLNENLSVGYEGYVWYYDGARTYYQIADYTGYPYWQECAQYISDAYREYVIANNGVVQGYRVFPHGLYKNYVLTGNERAKDALNLLASKAAYASSGGGINVELIRETAYHLQARVFAAKVGTPLDSAFNRSINFALGHFDSLVTEAIPNVHQPFFDGLMASALIEAYDQTQDTRIPTAIAKIADHIWSGAWIAEDQGMFYAFNDVRYENKGEAPVNQLISPMYAWLWNLTGEDKYRVRGDMLFQGGVRQGEGNTAWFGKGFNQTFRGSFGYVQSRLNKAIQSDITAPKLFEINSKPNLPGEVIIRWLSDEPSTTKLEFGLSSTLGSTVERASLVNKHTVVLKNLTPGRTYHFRVSSKDASNNLAQTQIRSFLAPSSDSAPPELYSLNVEGDLYSWLSDEVSDTELLWGTTPALGSSTKAAANSWTSRPGLYHEVTNYTSPILFFKGRSRDTAGNVSETPLLSNYRGSPPGKPNSPVVSLTSPSNNSTLSGIQKITGNVSDDGPWVEAQLYVNAQKIGFPDSIAPFEFTWDTTRAENGNYKLYIVGKDADGKMSQSPTVNVFVNNGQGPVAPRAPLNLRQVQ